MTLAQLKAIVDRELKDHPEKADVPVAIALSQEGIGGTPKAYVNYAGIGIDWDSGAFLVCSKDRVIKERKG
jgi:hypothetical protein